MFVLVSYDIGETEDKAGAKRLRRVAQACENFGQRVQFSVFECNVSDKEWTKLKLALLKHFDPEKDSLRFYFLGSNQGRIEHHGVKPSIDFEGELIV
ncbi:MAG: CRISPR-associated endonuclease Cas2 [Candidatus Caenarcaniphilales bacterium]|nr:CRISPR-associated endonuclease Cas2 [Candidatus Caenarcaniphilales bacterium]